MEVTHHYLLDTNILLYALKGLADVRLYFNNPPSVSVISEIELLGVKDIDDAEIKICETLIEYCKVLSVTDLIKKRTISLKRKNKLAIPDALIAATAIEENLVLVTADKGFKSIQELSLILIEV